jgi:hypothetical protein
VAIDRTAVSAKRRRRMVNPPSERGFYMFKLAKVSAITSVTVSFRQDRSR